jgi:hypothetical protein
LGQARSEIFLQMGLDRKSTDELICLSGKIRRRSQADEDTVILSEGVHDEFFAVSESVSCRRGLRGFDHRRGDPDRHRRQVT